MKSFFKNLFSFKFTVKRFLIAILLILIFVIVGVSVDKIYKYLETPEKLSEKYERELKRNVELDTKEVIQIQKYDFNNDRVKDYIAIIGNPETGTGNSYSKNIELYSDLDIIFLNGKSNEVLKYSTKKDFATNVTFNIYEDKDTEYIFVTDSSSGNVVMLKLEENNFINIIKNSFGDTFNGYTIDMSFDKDDKNKLNVNLDNYGKSYLPEDTKTYTLDFTDKNIDLKKYRQTYNLDKFTKFELKDIDSDGIFELVTSQYMLYLYKEAENMQANLGNVIIIFKYKDGKYKFDKVSVEI